MLSLKTIDAHAAGEPLRLVVGGFPSPTGRTMLEKREWVKRHADHLRRALMLEPRGHADMYGAILTEPVAPGSHAGVLFMHNEGYSTMCGHGIIAVTTIALERGLLDPGGDGCSIVYDSPAGTVRARAAVSRRTGDAAEGDRGARVDRVAFQNVPSFVLHGGLAVKLARGQARVDVAFGGAFYAIVDAESVGLPIDIAHLPELRRVGMEIKQAVEAQQSIVHPVDPGLRGIYGTIFTGPPSIDALAAPRGLEAPSDERADLRNVTIFADAEVDRSPCGTGTAAVMAVVDAMGLLAEDRPFVHESLIHTRFAGRIAGRTLVGEYQAIVPEIEGSAWITGEHTFLVDERDPLREGFRL
ncbi:MAG TPA: proline racemase family protein [Vicinamibacterales bacterium]|nr:proline racemase family protein [Vicinamibacterales bacterium]